jgi:hypothetical protein
LGVGAALAAGSPDATVALWVGAPQASGTGSVRGLAANGATVVEWVGHELGARFGACLTELGDLDGDGAAELAIAAPGSAEGGMASGLATVFSGADGSPLWSASGGPFDGYGTSITAVEDLDGDGRAELAIGVPFDDDGGFNAGAVELRSGATGALLWRALGSGVGDRFGERVAPAGDVDGDGLGDLCVGVPGADGANFDCGAVTVVSGVDGATLFTRHGSGAGAFATTVGRVDDLDGDGRPDFALGSPSSGAHGRVWVWSGVDGSLLLERDGGPGAEWFGAALVGAGDLDGDGARELWVGAPGHEDDSEAGCSVLGLSIETPPLRVDDHQVQLGASQLIRVDLGPAAAGEWCLPLGALAAEPLGLWPPIQLDAYGLLCLAGAAPVSPTLSALDVEGRAAVHFTPPQHEAVVGATVWHSAVRIDPSTIGWKVLETVVPAVLVAAP